MKSDRVYSDNTFFELMVPNSSPNKKNINKSDPIQPNEINDKGEIDESFLISGFAIWFEVHF